MSAAAPTHDGFASAARRQRNALLALNALGGLAVLVSYAIGLGGSSSVGNALWGGIPEALRPVYTVNMFLAAGGYFLFTPYIALRLSREPIRYPGGFGFGIFHVLYALVLIPSALWLPLTEQMVLAPGAALWWSIRFVLFLVGAGAVGLLVVLSKLPSSAPPGRGWAIAGLAPFVLQTAVLDALIWPAFYPGPV